MTLMPFCSHKIHYLWLISPLNLKQNRIMGGDCSSAGRAGWLAIRRSLVQSPGRAACRSVLERDTEPHVAHQWGPCDKLATCPGSTLPSPWDVNFLKLCDYKPQTDLCALPSISCFYCDVETKYPADQSIQTDGDLYTFPVFVYTVSLP